MTTANTTQLAPQQAAFISSEEAAVLLGVCKSTVLRLARNGLLSTRRLPYDGARVRILREDVERLARESYRPAKTKGDAADAAI